MLLYGISGAAGFIASGLFVTYRLRCASSRMSEIYPLFKERLAFYASMQFDPQDSKSDHDPAWSCIRSGFCLSTHPHKPTLNVLSCNQHRILLGILKKTEAKSATVATIVIFALAAIVTILTSEIRLDKAPASALYFTAGILALLLILSVDAAGHLGQRDYNRLTKKVSQSIRGRELQKQLVRDAIKKEEQYSASWWLMLSVALGGIASFVLHHILNWTC